MYSLCFVQMNWQTVIGLGIICLSVLIGVPLIIVFIGNFFKNFAIKTKHAEINFNNNNNDREPELLPVEESDIQNTKCINSICHPVKINLIVTKIADINYKIFVLDYHVALEEQRSYAKQKLMIIQDFDLKQYLNYLSDIVKTKYLTRDNVLKSDDYQMYCSITHRIYLEVMRLFEKYLIENHIDSYDDREFEDYKKERIEYIIIHMNQILEISYLSNAMIPYSEWNTESEKNITPKLKEEFNDIFNKARKITINKNEKVNNLRKDLDSFIFNICHNIDIDKEVNK